MPHRFSHEFAAFPCTVAFAVYIQSAKVQNVKLYYTVYGFTLSHDHDEPHAHRSMSNVDEMQDLTSYIRTLRTLYFSTTTTHNPRYAAGERGERGAARRRRRRRRRRAQGHL